MLDLSDIYNLSRKVFSMPEGIEKLKTNEKLLVDKYNFYKNQLEVLKYGTSMKIEMQHELEEIINSTIYSIMEIRDQIMDFEENN